VEGTRTKNEGRNERRKKTENKLETKWKVEQTNGRNKNDKIKKTGINKGKRKTRNGTEIMRRWEKEGITGSKVSKRGKKRSKECN
jgi:hypothetical protein